MRRLFSALLLFFLPVTTPAQIKKPTYLRFAWDEKAQPNLVNAVGLPCIPFRTDKSE